MTKTTNQLIVEIVGIMNAPFGIVSKDPQVIAELICGPRQQDEHMKAWRFECYRTGNFHYSPRYSSRIVYGIRDYVA